ncbi:unnamed protein product [Timema podura]|uniref:CUB domain-containing protein n=1 Tax=Timema podura TaxID=61482 RepID=A0ABN7NNM1_TIMPD|nr:unnamed protein product [Timema podura]
MWCGQFTWLRVYGSRFLFPVDTLGIIPERGITPTVIRRESGKPLRENYRQCTRLGLNPDLPVFASLAQHEIIALDHVTTEAGRDTQNVFGDQKGPSDRGLDMPAGRLLLFHHLDRVTCSSNVGSPGTCFPLTNCLRLGGRPSGVCAYGLAVCCVINKKCNDTSSAEVVNFVNPSYPKEDKDSSSCILTIQAYKKNICQIRTVNDDPQNVFAFLDVLVCCLLLIVVCSAAAVEVCSATRLAPMKPVVHACLHSFALQALSKILENSTTYANHRFRLDFDQFELASEPNVNAGTGESSMDCSDTGLTVKPNPGGSLGFTALCGNNTGQHLYIPVDTSLGPTSVQLTVVTSGATLYRWKIRATQVDCTQQPLDVAPPGCLQYYTDERGSFSSFGYGSGNGGYMSNLNYAVCIRRTTGSCGIRYSAPDSFKMAAVQTTMPSGDMGCDPNTSDSDTPTTNEPAATLSSATPPPITLSPVSEQPGVGGRRSRQVQTSSGVSRDFLYIPEAHVEGTQGHVTKFCGDFLDKKTITSVVPGPYVVWFHSDGKRAGKETGDELGFKVNFQQLSVTVNDDLQNVFTFLDGLVCCLLIIVVYSAVLLLDAKMCSAARIGGHADQNAKLAQSGFEGDKEVGLSVCVRSEEFVFNYYIERFMPLVEEFSAANQLYYEQMLNVLEWAGKHGSINDEAEATHYLTVLLPALKQLGPKLVSFTSFYLPPYLASPPPPHESSDTAARVAYL